MTTILPYLIGQNNHRSIRILNISATVLAVLLFLPVQVLARSPGAIFTTTEDGAIVNENVRYGAKEDVYLDGGPGPNAPRRMPLDYPRVIITSRSLIPAERIYCRRIIFPVAGSM